MKIYSNLHEISSLGIPDWEYEVLNELKDDTRRTDANCIQHTRFLFEMDGTPLKEQCDLAETLKSKLVRITYSGSKSIHCIIEFDPVYENDCKQYYKQIWDYIDKHYFKGRCDRQCSNPSRLTRTPNVLRKDTQKIQKLLYNNPTQYFPSDTAKLMLQEIKANAEFDRIHKLVNDSLNSQKMSYTAMTDCNGKCLNYNAVKNYLDTPYPNIKGNGTSNTSLFAAICCCIKYHDEQTLNTVIEKAKSEHWTDREIEYKIKSAKEKQ